MPFPTDDPLSAETIPELLVEAYVMGTLTSEQAQAVEALAHSFPGVAKRIASAQAEILPLQDVLARLDARHKGEDGDEDLDDETVALYIDNALTPERRIQVEETLARSSSAQTRLIARLREMNAFSEEAFQPGAVSTAESDPIPVSFRPRLISRPPSAAHEAPPHSPSARTARGGLCMGVGLGLFALSAVFAPAYPWAAAIACTGIVVGSWGAAITFGFSLRRPPATRFSRRAFAVAAGSSVAVSIVSIWAGFFLPRYLPYAQMLSLLAAFFALFCKALEHSSSHARLPHQSSSREEFRQEDTVRRQKGI